MAAANWYSLLSGVFSVVNGLGLALGGGAAVTVIQGKVPKSEKELEDTILPVIYATCSGRPVRSAWNASADPRANNLPTKINTYAIELTRVAASNADNSTAALADYLSWQQVIVRAVAGAPTQITVSGAYSEIFEVNYDEEPPIDRQAWDALYDLSGLNILYDVVEPCLGAG